MWSGVMNKNEMSRKLSVSIIFLTQGAVLDKVNTWLHRWAVVVLLVFKTGLNKEHIIWKLSKSGHPYDKQPRL